MRLAIDIECNSLINPTQIWLIVCKDMDMGELYVYRNITSNVVQKEAFLRLMEEVTLLVGHNLLDYDLPVLGSLIGYSIDISKVIDTLIISKLVDYSRSGGHSIEDYGTEFGIEKKTFYKFDNKELHNVNSILFKQLEDYCVRDVEICASIYHKYGNIITDPNWHNSIVLEHQFQLVVNSLHTNGFSFNISRAEKLLEKVTLELSALDKDILEQFPPTLRLIKEITPRRTKHGTLHKQDFRWVEGGDLSEFNGGPFCRCTWSQFNPSSHKQVVTVLRAADWKPTDKTQTHIEASRKGQVDQKLLDYGWKINEVNLATLPRSAPAPARTLARRILVEARRRTLTEWLGLVQEDGRIHGQFRGMGAWTHRMSHQRPNTANIPKEYKVSDGSRTFLGKELRSLWQAPRGRLLVGVDAETIQLRVFAHYIDDREFTNALVNGNKADKTDAHSLNQILLGRVCKTREAAKHGLYAYLLGGGFGKIGQIMACSKEEAEEAFRHLLERYRGFSYLKKHVIPEDARRSYFIGLDGRRVSIPGNSPGERRHLAMSGYLQNGEAVIMKRACLKWHDLLQKEDAILVDFVHDEWQTEVPNNMEIALRIAKMQSDSLEEVGRELGLKCPLAGSYWSDDHDDYTIGTNWSVTH